MRYPEDFEIIFDGGPLLPPRRSKPPRWWTMGGHVAVTEPDPTEATRLREATRPKRAYTRSGRYATRQQPPLEVTCIREDNLCQEQVGANGSNIGMRLSDGVTTHGETDSEEPNKPSDTCGLSTNTCTPMGPGSLISTKPEFSVCTKMGHASSNGRLPTLPDRPVALAGESATPGVGTGRLSVEPVQTLTHHQTTTVTEPNP